MFVCFFHISLARRNREAKYTMQKMTAFLQLFNAKVIPTFSPRFNSLTHISSNYSKVQKLTKLAKHSDVAKSK